MQLLMVVLGGIVVAPAGAYVASAAFALGCYSQLRRRRRDGFCTTCGYDLTGNVSGRCPECGTEIGA